MEDVDKRNKPKLLHICTSNLEGYAMQEYLFNNFDDQYEILSKPLKNNLASLLVEHRVIEYTIILITNIRLTESDLIEIEKVKSYGVKVMLFDRSITGISGTLRWTMYLPEKLHTTIPVVAVSELYIHPYYVMENLKRLARIITTKPIRFGATPLVVRDTVRETRIDENILTGYSSSHDVSKMAYMTLMVIYNLKREYNDWDWITENLKARLKL